MTRGARAASLIREVSSVLPGDDPEVVGEEPHQRRLRDERGHGADPSACRKPLRVPTLTAAEHVGVAVNLDAAEGMTPEEPAQPADAVLPGVQAAGRTILL